MNFYAFTRSIDFKVYEKIPVNSLNERLFMTMLDRQQTHSIEMKLRYNHVITHDSLWPINDNVEFKFYQLYLEETNSFVKLDIAGREGKDSFAVMSIELSQKMEEHERTAYNLLNFVGDVGGVSNFLRMIAAFFVSKFAYHSYIIKAI